MEQPKRARRRKPETAKANLEPPLKELRRTGLRREAGSEGYAEKYRAVLNGGYSKDEPVGQRWGKVEPALWRRRRSHPPTTPRCLRSARYGRSLGVTPGGLSGSSGGTEGSDPISASEVGSGVLGIVGRPSSTRSVVKATRPETETWRQSVSGKAAGEDGWGETESEMSKAGEVDSSLSERPEHHRPRRLADWINPTGARKVHSLIDIYKRKNLEIGWERVKANQGAGGLTVKASRRLAKGSKSASPDCMRSFAPTITSPNRCGSSVSRRWANQVSGAC